MKKVFKFLLVGIVIVFIFVNLGCKLDEEEKKAEVRFQNWTDLTLLYGVKYGDAVYIGEMAPGFISGYYETAPGAYSLQAKDINGNWQTVSDGSLSVEGGHKYTIVGTGAVGVYFWNVVQDS